MACAYQRCKVKQGTPRIEGHEFADIEAYGEERWLDELADALRRKTYRADSKKLRPLGDSSDCGPRGYDGVLEAIFDVDMPAEQHGYRPERPHGGAFG
jgi:RNA-directed DNA polymerase